MSRREELQAEVLKAQLRADASKEQDRKQSRLAGLWGTMNSLKREGDNQRATLAEQHGVNAATLPGFGAEIPFGNTFLSQNSTGSPRGKLAQVAILALAAGAAGFGLHSLLKETPKTEAPPPVDAVLEWEITPNGESGRRGVSTETSGFHSETSGVVSGGDRE